MLVVNVINAIKQKHPFIDLLKPEGLALIPLLIVLDIKVVKEFYDAIQAWYNKFKESSDFVLGYDSKPIINQPSILASFSEVFPNDSFHNDYNLNKYLIEKVKEMQKEEKYPEMYVSDKDANLNIFNFDWLREFWEKSEVYFKNKEEQLKDKGQKWLLKKTLEEGFINESFFKIDNNDEQYKFLLENICESIDLLISGHTHLPRWIESKPVYLNTGTWARIIGLREEWFPISHISVKIYCALFYPRFKRILPCP